MALTEKEVFKADVNNKLVPMQALLDMLRKPSLADPKKLKRLVTMSQKNIELIKES